MIGIEYKGRLGNNMFQYALAQLIKKKRNFNFQIKEVKFIYVIILSLFFTFQQFSEGRFYLQENKYFDTSMSIDNYYLINIFLSFYVVLVLISLFIEPDKKIIDLAKELNIKS